MEQSLKELIETILSYMPNDWVRLTTHRLDIYNEDKAKVEFLAALEKLSADPKRLASQLTDLPTAYDYIRLGHPLSCLLEWGVAKLKNKTPESLISFSSQTMPLLAILRKNLLEKTKTRVLYSQELPASLNQELLEQNYGYKFKLEKVSDLNEIADFDGVTVIIKNFNDICKEQENSDIILYTDTKLGSVVEVGDQFKKYISEIQHVRRRESIAMTPHNCLAILESFVDSSKSQEEYQYDLKKLETKIETITNTQNGALFGSCGLSIQYAIMMGLIHWSNTNHPDKEIKFIVPPNCYGGTNDQARRVAACLDQVEIVDLAVDRGKDMGVELDKILENLALENCVPFIIAEIPTNPRVEVPDLDNLAKVLSKPRKTNDGVLAVASVFILDQTFCPNVKFLGQKDILGGSKTISYVSGSKFPSGGLCTAGYCVANNLAEDLMPYVKKNLELCDNKATDFQLQTLEKQIPSMLERIQKAYENTRAFVDYIETSLPSANINFVSHELGQRGFTPSVFSLDLPTKGNTPEEKELYKRELNKKLIGLMIDNIKESKHCVSYGQLKGCYWTIPATSTQGTTKEGDKDYIVRVSIAPDFDLEAHKRVFNLFLDQF